MDFLEGKGRWQIVRGSNLGSFVFVCVCERWGNFNQATDGKSIGGKYLFVWLLTEIKVKVAIQRRSALPCQRGWGLKVSSCGGVDFLLFFLFSAFFAPSRRAPATFLLGYLYMRSIYATLCR